MARAIFNGQVIAESDEIEIVEGNKYFPPSSIKSEFFQEIDKNTTCPWKGVASYYDVVVDGETASGAAWYYPATKDAAKQIENYVAFYTNKVQVEG